MFASELTTVSPKLLEVSVRPSRWRLTYAFELQLWKLDGGQDAGSNRVVNLPINPQEYRVTANAAQATQHTVGGIAADENGWVELDIVVAGTCGLAPKRGWSAGTGFFGGNLVYGDGNLLWRELRNLFRVYGKLAQEGGALTPRMVWHDFRLDDHWIVIPKVWDMDRRASEHRLHYPYRIEMTAVGADEAPSGGVFGLFEAIRNVVAAIVAAVNTITGFVRDAGAFIGAISNLVDTVIAAVQSAGRDLLAAAADLLAGISDVLNVSLDIALGWRSTVSDLRSAVADHIAGRDPWTPRNERGSQSEHLYAIAGGMEEALDGILAHPEAFSRSWPLTAGRSRQLTRGEALLSQAEVDAAVDAPPATVRGLSVRATPGSGLRRGAAPPDEQPPQYVGQRAYEVREGDTILSVAAREMGSSDLWVDLAAANLLLAPYFSRLGLPRTAQPGQVIQIPVLANGARAFAAAGGETRGDADLVALGLDVYLRTDGEWEIDASGADIRVVGGIDNYAQALERIRFQTEVGSNLVFPPVGILAPIGEPQAHGVPEAIAVSVRRAVLQDSRSEAIKRLTLVDEGDGVSVEVEVVPRGGRGSRVLRRAVE